MVLVIIISYFLDSKVIISCLFREFGTSVTIKGGIQIERLSVL
jgi:hypothetical protein